MSNHGPLKHRVHKRAVRSGRRLSCQRLAAYIGLSFGAIILAVAVLLQAFGVTVLNRYGKAKVERAFADAHPGCALRIGDLDYSVSANRLVAQSVAMSATNALVQVGRISLTGVRWAQLLWGTATLAEVLAKASLEATNLVIEFPLSHYGIRCARLRASVPGSELRAEATELHTLVSDEKFFAAHAFRATRYHVVLPECGVVGLEYGELLRGNSYRARSIYFDQPVFEALVNRDKPVDPFVQRPLMVHEALAAIRPPLQVDRLSITNGGLRYCERVVAGAEPGVLTFAAVNMSVEGIANHGEPSAAIHLRGQGELMSAGTLKVLMTIPIAPPDFSLHYSGSLSVMDLTRLDAFLDIAEHTRIKSGRAHEVAFEINVIAGQAQGHVRAIYQDLVMAVLDEQTGTDKGFDNRIASFLVNALKIRNANAPDAAGAMKEGNVNYTRKPEDAFQQFVWFALRSGVLDVISH